MRHPDESSTPSPLIDIRTAATLLGVSRWTVRRLIDTGDLPVVRLPSGGGSTRRRLLLDPTDVAALIHGSKVRDL